MQCPQCATGNPDFAAFCIACGARLAVAVGAPPDPAPAQAPLAWHPPQQGPPQPSQQAFPQPPQQALAQPPQQTPSQPPVWQPPRPGGWGSAAAAPLTTASGLHWPSILSGAGTALVLLFIGALFGLIQNPLWIVIAVCFIAAGGAATVRSSPTPTLTDAAVAGCLGTVACFFVLVLMQGADMGSAMGLLLMNAAIGAIAGAVGGAAQMAYTAKHRR